MNGERPSRPRVQPVDKVAARAQEISALGGLVRPVNLTATLAHNVAVSKALNTFSATFFDPGLLDPRLRELVILRMAWRTRCVYEWGQHVGAARAVGVTHDEIEALGGDAGRWTPLEAVAFRLVDDLHADDCVSDATWGALTSLVDDATAIALVGVATCYRMVAGILNSLGVQPEPDLPGWPA